MLLVCITYFSFFLPLLQYLYVLYFCKICELHVRTCPFVCHDAEMFCAYFTFAIIAKKITIVTHFVWPITLDCCCTFCKPICKDEIPKYAKFSHTQNSLVLQYIGHRKPINFFISPSRSSSFPHHLKLSAEDHTSQLDGVLDQVRDLADKLKAIQDTLEGWRSRLKDHEPPHVLPKDVEAQLQQLAVSGMFVGNQMLSKHELSTNIHLTCSLIARPRVWISLIPRHAREPGNKPRSGYETSVH